MTVKRGTRAAGVVLIGVLGVGLGIAHDPYLLVRAQFERQRINAGLDEVEVAVAGHRWTAADIRQPALLLWGRQDAVIDPSALDLNAALIPHARTVLVDAAGHMALMEQPRAVADAVVELIKRGQPR